MAEHQIGFAVVTHDRTPVLLCCCGSRSTESMVQFAELLDPEANGFARLKPTPPAHPYAGRCARQNHIAGLHRYSCGDLFDLLCNGENHTIGRASCRERGCQYV